ncbi:DUF1819 family protein [Methylocaldum sp. RMAD-M]|jgi:hypothetical protein|uniref:DUF1819 family protein n=1 Tax=Methylocaldum sp. RMAD-M TaxID=2806557 RepID=UPI001AE80F74|nr:DUF1819 family protein [Methylocaldum sp. RMAD-M]MBP1152764.1 hypothetical protein [Methylocaldum sp. RMAD-M]
MALYNAEISAGSLMLPESRRVAALLLSNPTDEQWAHALRVENLLQKKSPATARRQAKLIRNRLQTVDHLAWSMISTREPEVALQMLLAASIKHSRLLGDFMREIVGGHLRHLETKLNERDWDNFMIDCAQRDPSIAQWSDSTKKKLSEVVARILAEARFIKSTRDKQLTPPMLHPDVRRYLVDHNENYVLSCMELR